MPRISRTPDQVDAFRQEILDAALHIIVEQGFHKLSMRKIASRLGVTATTIYSYYASRDELYFFIRISGFELLFESIANVYKAKDDPYEKLRAAAGEYVRFGICNPDYYEVMFISRGVPKFLDCIDTPLEKVASREKEKSIKTFLFIARGIADYMKISDMESRYLTIRLWTELNGAVSLLNSRLLREVEEHTGPLVERLVDDICERFRQLQIEKSLKNSSKKRRGI